MLFPATYDFHFLTAQWVFKHLEFSASRKQQQQQIMVKVHRKGALMFCWWECKLVQPLWKSAWSASRN
jgi:hypothetical protein